MRFPATGIFKRAGGCCVAPPGPPARSAGVDPAPLAARSVGGCSVAPLIPALILSACASAARPATRTYAVPSPPSFKDRLAAGIVTVRVTGQEWNWKTPWAKQGPWTRTMSGLVVPGPRILVASAGLGNHVLIEVQRDGRESRTPARLVLVDHEAPLGLVEAGHRPPLAALGPARFRVGSGAPGAGRTPRPLAAQPADPRRDHDHGRRGRFGGGGRGGGSHRSRHEKVGGPGRGDGLARAAPVPGRRRGQRLPRLRPGRDRLAGPHEPRPAGRPW